jgi:alpha-tubulin suppressor-like RCC1 family protein
MPASSHGNSHLQLGTRVIPSSDTKSPAQLVPGDESSLDIRYNTTLNPINSLASIPISQISAGDRTSFVRTSPEGRVLGFGANEFGQIGLGANFAVDVVPTPTEIILAKEYRGGTIVKCLDVAAGGNNTFFIVERSGPQDDGKTFVDVLAVGSGLHGTLGNGLWSSVSGQPAKVKT